MSNNGNGHLKEKLRQDLIRQTRATPPPLAPPVTSQAPRAPSTVVWRFLITRRRSIIVLILAVALVAFLAWLPPETRRALITGLLAQRLVVGLLLFFSLLSLSLLWSAGERLDARIFLFFNQHKLRNLNLDRVMWLATQLGGGLFGLGLAGFLFILSYRRLAIEMVFGTLTLWLFVELVKALADRTRPFISLAEIRVVGRRAIGRSFPSGHTSQAFFLASLFIHHFELGFLSYLPLFGLAALVGFTRIYIGMHYPRDVLAGAILGVIWGLLITLLDPYLFVLVR